MIDPVIQQPEWHDALCTCGHRREEHCLDEDHCIFRDGEYGGACLAYPCNCNAFETPP